MSTESSRTTLPAWATWPEPNEQGAYTVGIEEEVMLLDQLTWALASRIDSVLPRLPHGRTTSFTAETHGSALEIQTGVPARSARRSKNSGRCGGSSTKR